MQCKDKTPRETIEAVSTYFSNCGLTFVEKISNNQSIYPSYTLLNPETGIIVNGKGIDTEYALASAYGEFCERLFNRCFLRFGHLRPQDLALKIPDYVELEMDEVRLQIEKFIKLESIDTEFSNDLYKVFVELTKLYQGKNNTYLCIPFSINAQDQLHLPLYVCDYYLGTNGMASGNTYHEAFVQAFSEIIERKAVKDFNGGIIVPNRIAIMDIGGDDGFIMNTLQKIKESLNVEIFIYTFESYYHFPVAFLLLLDRNKHKVKFKFGAHCTIYHALERCITEIVQGTNLEDSSKWLDMVDIYINETGDNMRIFTDGSGNLSRYAFESCLKFHDVYHTNWNPENNADAYERIRNMRLPIYVKVNSLNPLVTLQLYIPNWSAIREIPGTDIHFELRKMHLFAQLLAVTGYGKDFEKLVSELRDELGIQTMLSNIACFVCPIERQYLRRFTVADIALVVAMEMDKSEYSIQYFIDKHMNNNKNNYITYAIIKLFYKKLDVMFRSLYINFLMLM